MYLPFTVILSIVLVWECVGISAYREKPPKGKETEAKMSPWELHVLNDIMIEISLLQCPTTINKPAARAMKNFVSEAVKKATFHETMNPNFWPVYNNLVQCMDHLEEQGKNHGEVMRSAASVMSDATRKKSGRRQLSENGAARKMARRVIAENTDDEKGWISNAWERIPDRNARRGEHTTEDAIFVTAPDITKARKEKPAEFSYSDSTKDTMQSMTNVMSNMNDWVSSFMRFKRSEPAVAPPKEDTDYDNEESIADAVAKQKFQKMFITIHQILRKACPRDLRPTGQFSGQIIREFLMWVSETYDFSEASKEFFDKERLLQQAQKCMLTL